MGTAEQTRDFCRSHQVEFPCLSDPEVKTYRAYGLERGSFAQVMGPAVLLKAIVSSFKGNRGRQLGQDVFQMPGTFVIDRDGTIRFCHRNRDASDNPTFDRVLSALPAAA